MCKFYSICSELKKNLYIYIKAAFIFLLNFAVPSPLLEAICKRKDEFTYSSKLRIAVATWNVNGGKHFNSIVFKHQSMTEWLLDCPKLYKNTGIIFKREFLFFK